MIKTRSRSRRKSQSELSRKPVLDFRTMREFCEMMYGHRCAYREIPLPECKGYFLTEKGHLLHFLKREQFYRLVNYVPLNAKASEKVQKSGFPVDHYYQDGKRQLFKSRGKMMLVTFKGWPISKAVKFTTAPIDGNNNNVDIDNIKFYESSSEAIKSYVSHKLELPIGVIKRIQKSSKSDQYFANKHNLSVRTIKRYRKMEISNC